MPPLRLASAFSSAFRSVLRSVFRSAFRSTFSGAFPIVLVVVSSALTARPQGLISATPGGVAGSGPSGLSGLSLSADGRFVAFDSDAPDLVAGAPAFRAVYLRDTLLEVTELVSVSSAGTPADAMSVGASVSSDGSRVAFTSLASNLWPGVPASTPQVYVRDRQSGLTSLASLSSAGAVNTGWIDVVRLAGDGGHVLFTSSSDELAPGDSNHVRDLFVRDLAAGTTERVSVGEFGQSSPQSTVDGAISDDGRYVLFVSYWDPMTGGDFNGAPDLLVRDRSMGTTTRIPLPAGGLAPGDALESPRLAGDGTTALVRSAAAGLAAGLWNGRTQLFAVEVASGAVELVSRSTSGAASDEHVYAPSLSRDGRRVAFVSRAAQLASVRNNHAFDAFVHDRDRGETWLASVRESGAALRKPTFEVALSADGAALAFTSDSGALAAGDHNATSDVFKLELAHLPPQRYCLSSATSDGCAPAIAWSGSSELSAPGRFTVRAGQLPAASVALCVFGPQQTLTPFPSGYLCVAAPRSITPPQPVIGTGAPCGGSAEVDFEALAASGAHPWLVSGVATYAQFWFRDAADPVHGAGTSDAVRFTLR